MSAGVPERARAAAAALLLPIAGDRPAGEDTRGDPRAQWIGDAMLVEPSVRRDWAGLGGRAGELLREIGKDLRLAAIWAMASFEQGGLQGLAAGLWLCEGLLGGEWEGLQPARARARENALANLYEHLALRLPTLTDADADAVAACQEALEALHAAALLRLTPPPHPRAVLAELARLAPPSVPFVDHHTNSVAPATAWEAPPADASTSPTARAPTPQAPPVEAPPRPRVLAPDPGTSGAGEGADLADDDARFLAGLTRGMARAAAGLRRRAEGDPLAYRLLRCAAWIRAARPPRRADGRADVDALPAAERARLDAMLRSGKWSALVDAAESLVAAPAGRFWLDLHRLSAVALAALGHRDAHDAVLAELAGLLRRMPELPELCARDGVPLADPETRAWLVAQRLVVDEGASPRPALAPEPARSDRSPAPGSEPAQPAAPAEAALAGAEREAPADLEAARARARAARDPAAALAHLHTFVAAARTPRERFRGRAALADLAVELGLWSVARALYTALEAEARERGLAEWDPALVAPCLAGLLRCDRAEGRSPGAEHARIFAQLCLLDPGAAARVASPPGR